jgi:ABC-2 type transport system ATP-binding protein
VLDQTIDTLSKGFKRRVGLAQAIVHDPPVLVLDEPTDGLDPNQKHEVRTLISEMAPGKTIVISTHILEEVDAVCTRAIIVAHGRLLVDERPAVLQARSRYHNAVTLTVAEPADLPHIAAALRAAPGVGDVEVDLRDGRLTALPAPGQLPLAAVSELASREHWNLHELRLEAGRLDEVFRSVTSAAEQAP